MRRLALLALALAGCGSSAATDAGPPDARPMTDAGPPGSASRYPEDRTQSPMTTSVAANLHAIATRGALAANVFAKVGDSITVDPHFMQCFTNGSMVDLGAQPTLQPTIDFFKAGVAGTTDPFQRASLAASVGKTALWALTPPDSTTPDPLDQELTALTPRYAVIMYGTNDAGYPTSYIHTYAAAMFDIVDELLAQGTIPILSTIPPRDDDPTVANLMVPRENEVVRAIAQARQIPYVDFHRELILLPNDGLTSADHVHPNFDPTGACLLTADGLMYGYNVRNLITLTALTRAKAAVDGLAAPDPDPPALAGTGTVPDPFLIDSLPFVDSNDTSLSKSSDFDTYTGCSASQNESGPEFVYKITLAQSTMLRATVFVRGSVDVDIHLLSGPTVAQCLERNDKEILDTVAAGTYYLVVDTFVPSGGTPAAGEYLLSVTDGAVD